jgi:hypothetical protein
MTFEAALAKPVNLMMSGPAGGVKGALWIAKKAGYMNLLTYDMGGTSTDVALIAQPLQEEVFAKLFNEAELAKLSPEEMRSYDESLKVYWDNKNTMDYAIKTATEKEKKKEKKRDSRRDARREKAKP